MLIILAIECSNGDVWLTDDKIPKIYWNGTWAPICGHYFWDNNYGATLFCQKMGYQNGTVFGKTNFQRHAGERYSEDAFRVGKCFAHNDLTRCRGGCNDYKLGGKCYENDDAMCAKGQPVKTTIQCYGGSKISKNSSCTGKCEIK